ncbi:MAG: type II secretion system F family protein [Nanoarchaeota archaeon]|nr:type II secretion system F family protein [Nanoarchaeota archaeon]
MSNFFNEFGKAFVPESILGRPIRSRLRKYLLTAGYLDVPYNFFGVLFILSAAITYLIFILLLYPTVQGEGLVKVFLTSFFGWAIIQALILLTVFVGIYFFLNLKIYKRTKIIESHLADFLIFVSTNLKGGLSLEQSLWAAIRPEFELLAQEMTIVSKRVMTGNDLTEALGEFVEKYNSQTLKSNMGIIIGEIESGGKLVKVIDKVIATLKKSKALQDEMAASTVTYIIFIGVVVVLISPALFALSFQLLNIVIGFTQSIGASLSGSGGLIPINFNVQVDQADFKRFSILAIAAISICSSMIVSIIEKGDIKGGLKYIPGFTVTSLSLYFLFMFLLNLAFGGLV